MTPAERSARKAARELFNCLANGEQYITVAQLEKKMRQIYKLNSNRHRRGYDPTNDQDVSPYHSQRHNVLSNPGNNITEAHLISAAMHYSHGRLPAISSSLTLSVPHAESLDHIPYFHRLLFHPIMFLYLIYHKYLNALSKFPGSLANLFIFLLLVSYTTSINNVLSFVPVIIYHLSLFVMVVATLKMFKSKHRFDDFRIWSQLFLSFDQHVDTNASENQFLRREMQPYLIFFSAFFVNVIISTTTPLEWKMSSEVTIISFILLFVTLFIFMYNNRRPFPDLLVLLSFGINVLVKYPYEIDAAMWTNWLFFDLKVPTFASFSIGHGIEFCFNCRALLYLLMPAILVSIAQRQKWHGTYQCLIPHCVTLSWLQICIISSQSATMFEVVRGTLSLAGLLFCLPLFGVVTLMIPVFVTVESMDLPSSTMRLVASVSIAGVALILSCLLASHRRTKKYITILQVKTHHPIFTFAFFPNFHHHFNFQTFICVVAIFYITQPYVVKYFDGTDSDTQSGDMYRSMINHVDPVESLRHDDVSTSFLKWELFNRHCHTPLLYPGNRINSQLKCDQFSGVAVKWEGVVNNVEIKRVYNLRETILAYLPEILAKPITCWFGEPNELMYDVYDSEDLEFFKAQGKCNLNNWNTYEFRIGVKMDYSTIDLYLKTPNSFANFTRYINRSDRIWFKGTLLTSYSNPSGTDDSHEPTNAFNLERHPLWVDLSAIGCINCKDTSLKAIYAANHLKLSSRNIYNGIKYLFNVLFNPLIRIN